MKSDRDERLLTRNQVEDRFGIPADRTSRTVRSLSPKRRDFLDSYANECGLPMNDFSLPLTERSPV
jgi:hypothetical protein